MAVTYEWDLETVDEYGDILDHNFSEHVATLLERIEAGQNLVLVRQVGNDVEGIIDRTWAYCWQTKDGTWVLPDMFEDRGGAYATNVPARYHQELRKAQ